MIDNTDSHIIDLLTRNSRSNATQISNDLSKRGISLTPRSVLNRIARLEKQKTIQGYTVRLSPTYKLAIMKESPRVLQPTQEVKGDNASVPVKKHPTNDLEYRQNLLNQRYDEMFRSLAEHFHQKLDSF